MGTLKPKVGRDRREIENSSRSRQSRAVSARLWILACILKALGSDWRVQLRR